MKAYQGACSGDHSDETAELLGSQINEARNSIESAQRTFEDFNAANSERNDLFANFRADS